MPQISWQTVAQPMPKICTKTSAVMNICLGFGTTLRLPQRACFGRSGRRWRCPFRHCRQPLIASSIIASQGGMDHPCSTSSFSGSRSRFCFRSGASPRRHFCPPDSYKTGLFRRVALSSVPIRLGERIRLQEPLLPRNGSDHRLGNPMVRAQTLPSLQPFIRRLRQFGVGSRSVVLRKSTDEPT